ncbi:FxsB family cyclophane-forming radical SAM/SPASM peptide maturase [Virgisporangium ochraceum]|uniref:Radical SAM core domain-containing protein n=1 Tax=Virgisporangium ochraceum TaxID=65505 RepID=A0A8J4EEC5_9ACTN|nr:FxsB family cyclophane-forming radical SAM/SPASM peptide maturase [Virgisporangium ochraceum]GIJ72445.1 hypothetical protein Voc01_073620 [Virgisporangium ochraceum]
MTAGGWHPSAFNQFVVKVHSRCNLACDYCYVYESVDQGWRGQPPVMADDVFAEACTRIRDHVQRHAVPATGLVFHGGEPLLAGAARLDRFAATARRIVGPVTSLRLGLQTNGVLVTPAFVDVFARNRIRVAVSIDGDRAGHDRHRVTKAGGGSYGRAVAGVSALAEAGLLGGLLCTIDLSNDPVTTYDALAALNPPVVDFLLPHANWAAPPPGPAGAFGRWLVTVFDRWYRADAPRPRVRLFEEILTLLLGGRADTEAIGLAPVRVAVIETDGTLEQVDALKTTYAGATRLTLRGGGNPLDAALTAPSIVARQIGAAALGDRCRPCDLRDVCGGGNYTHRYDPATGFRNPSVFCPDLMTLIRHIGATVRAELDPILRKRRTHVA